MAPIARDVDIFFGLEAASDDGLRGMVKDATVGQTEQAIATARGLGYGVTGNFVIDPAWREPDFQRLWDFVERHRLHQAGFTILTPLPGTAYFEAMRPRLGARKWADFDMHHLLWQPTLGPERFFELYCETWRRSVLNLSGRKSTAVMAPGVSEGYSARRRSSGTRAARLSRTTDTGIRVPATQATPCITFGSTEMKSRQFIIRSPGTCP